MPLFSGRLARALQAVNRIPESPEEPQYLVDNRPNAAISGKGFLTHPPFRETLAGQSIRTDMHFSRLRLNGFKSFVDATELVINDGLTGVVGPKRRR